MTVLVGTVAVVGDTVSVWPGTVSVRPGTVTEGGSRRGYRGHAETPSIKHMVFDKVQRMEYNNIQRTAISL